MSELIRSTRSLSARPSFFSLAKRVYLAYMDTEISTDLKRLSEKLDTVYLSVEKTRKYMLWSLIMQVAVVLLPLVVLMLAVPFILSGLSGISNLYQGL